MEFIINLEKKKNEFCLQSRKKPTLLNAGLQTILRENNK